MEPQAKPADPQDARSDLDLIAAINRGDPDAFEVLYFRYRDWVVRLAFRFTGDESAAMDVLQETFLYFLRKFPGFRLTANLKSFLYPAVRNLSSGAREKAQRYQGTEIGSNEAEPATQPEPSVGPVDLEVVLAGLPPEQRDVLLLRFVDDLELLEIAQSLEIPLGTVKSRLHNALTTLRKDPRTKEFFGR